MRITQFLSTAILAIASVSASAASSSELETLLNSGRADEAFRVGTAASKPQGDRLFDYFLGVAAIDSGRGNEGVDLLRAYIAAHPGDLRAHLELARGYFLVNNLESARAEFLLVRKSPIPPQVAANIDSFLQAIDARKAGLSGVQPPSTWAGYLEAGIGYDSNVNGGVAGATVTLPVVGTATLDSSGVRQSASFARVAAGISGQHNFSRDWALFGVGSLDTRAHNRADNYDNLYATAQAGLAYLVAPGHALRFSSSFNSLELNGAIYRTSPSGLAEWQWAVNDRMAVSASLQEGRLVYRGSNEVRNAHFSTLAGGLRFGFAADWRPVLVASANYGKERNLNQRDDLSRDSSGARIGVELVPLDKMVFAAGYGEQSSRYVADDAFFALARRDYATSLDFSVTWNFSAATSLRGELSHSETHSNIGLYQNRRGVASMSLRHAF